ncbi:hypothetical protein OH76DRAFT_1478130 [Lentinus brumalis]|uniref:Uncharacterized protein n=1 Tax=Lentinus brumalis TaxID=2498619 RepID=A0A371DSG9_9APHY|nr:hypothetical protein OH76DRAFT_1478130 [Polyporus brumalis]
MAWFPHSAVPRCKFLPGAMLNGLPPILADTATMNGIDALTERRKEYPSTFTRYVVFVLSVFAAAFRLICRQLAGIPRFADDYATYNMYPLDPTPPRADGSDGITPQMSLCIGRRTSRFRGPRNKPPSIAIPNLYLWYETSTLVRVRYPSISCTPRNTIMLSNDFRCSGGLRKWIEQHIRNPSAPSVPSSAIFTADLSEDIEGFTSRSPLLALYQMVEDDFRRAGKNGRSADDVLGWQWDGPSRQMTG